MKDICTASKNKYKPFNNTALFVKYMKRLVKKNKEIKNFDDLLNEMRADKQKYTPELQWLLEFTYLTSLVQSQRFQDNYAPIFIQDEGMLQYFISFIVHFKSQYNQASFTIPDAEKRTNELLQFLTSNLLSYMDQLIPYYAYKSDSADEKAIRESFKDGIPILNCSALVTSIAACLIGISHSFRQRTGAMNYETYINGPGKQLYDEENLRLKYNICGIEAECGRKTENLDDEEGELRVEMKSEGKRELKKKKKEQQKMKTKVQGGQKRLQSIKSGEAPDPGDGHGKYIPDIASPPYV